MTFGHTEFFTHIQRIILIFHRPSECCINASTVVVFGPRAVSVAAKCAHNIVCGRRRRRQTRHKMTTSKPYCVRIAFRVLAPTTTKTTTAAKKKQLAYMRNETCCIYPRQHETRRRHRHVSLGPQTGGWRITLSVFACVFMNTTERSPYGVHPYVWLFVRVFAFRSHAFVQFLGHYRLVYGWHLLRDVCVQLTKMKRFWFVCVQPSNHTINHTNQTADNRRSASLVSSCNRLDIIYRYLIIIQCKAGDRYRRI